MTEIEAIKKAIRHFECMKNDAVVVLDSGFGTNPGESDRVYRNRKMYAELAISALEKQIPKKVVIKEWNPAICPTCGAELSESMGDGYYKHWSHLQRCPNPDCGQRLDWESED